MFSINYYGASRAHSRVHQDRLTFCALPDRQNDELFGPVKVYMRDGVRLRNPETIPVDVLMWQSKEGHAGERERKHSAA